MPRRLFYRHQHQLARQRVLDVRRIKRIDPKAPSQVLRQSRARRHEGRDADGRMVHQVLADTGEVVPDLDAHVLQMRRRAVAVAHQRSEEHTSELQSLMRNSYAVFCLKKQHSTIYTKRLHIKLTKSQ